MCWSEQASLSMTILGVVVTLLVHFRNYRPGHNKYDFLIPLFYTIMEGFQYLQHVVGFETCDETNTKLTIVAFYLVWFQPVVWNFWALKVSDGSTKQLFRCTTFISLVAVLFSTIGLIVGMNREHFPQTEEFLLQLGSKTCTYPSRTHFYWLFSVDSLAGFRPHWFTFLSLLSIPQLFRKNEGYHWWGPGWAATFIQIAGFFFGGWYFGDLNTIGGNLTFSAIFTHPIASGWCAFSVPSGIIMPIIGKIYKYLYYSTPVKNANDSKKRK